MAVKKSELYSSLWASCDELRGGKAIGISPANSKAATTAYDPTCGSAPWSRICSAQSAKRWKNHPSMSRSAKGGFGLPGGAAEHES